MTRPLYYIFGTIILILLVYVAYQQFTFYRQISSIQKELIESRKEFSEYKEKQNKIAIQIITEVNDVNSKKFGELYEKIDKINSISNDNRVIINKLHKTTTEAVTNYDSLTDDTRKRYNEAISELFNESTELLGEIAKEADRSTEAAITYHELLVEQKRIVDEANADKKLIK